MYENFEHVGICSIVVLGSFECEDMGSSRFLVLFIRTIVFYLHQDTFLLAV